MLELFCVETFRKKNFFNKSDETKPTNLFILLLVRDWREIYRVVVIITLKFLQGMGFCTLRRVARAKFCIEVKCRRCKFSHTALAWLFVCPEFIRTVEHLRAFFLDIKRVAFSNR